MKLSKPWLCQCQQRLNRYGNTGRFPGTDVLRGIGISKKTGRKGLWAGKRKYSASAIRWLTEINIRDFRQRTSLYERQVYLCQFKRITSGRVKRSAYRRDRALKNHSRIFKKRRCFKRNWEQNLFTDTNSSKWSVWICNLRNLSLRRRRRLCRRNYLRSHGRFKSRRSNYEKNHKFLLRHIHRF